MELEAGSARQVTMNVRGSPAEFIAVGIAVGVVVIAVGVAYGIYKGGEKLLNHVWS